MSPTAVFILQFAMSMLVITMLAIWYAVPPSREVVVDLGGDLSGIVEPEVFHHVKPLGRVTFFVEFFR